MIFLRGTIITLVLLGLWEAVVLIFHLPIYILPSPFSVIEALITQFSLIAHQMAPTAIETFTGLMLGVLMGCLNALILALFRPAQRWFMPVLLISQALPTFAIAPILVVWFGYGMTSKIIMTIIMLFFPVTNAFYDGLKNVPQGYLDLGQTMNASKWHMLWHIKIPAALPHLATGIRVATAIAPIGAIVGEWVGASAGLGFLMLNANARLQIDLLFAILLVIVIFTLGLYFTVDQGLKWLINW